MATFQAQVEGLTGLSIGTSPTTGELTEFLKDGVIDVTSKCIQFKPQDAIKFQRESGTQNSNGFHPKGAKIISVLREANADGDADGSTAWRNCRYIPAHMQSRVVDTDSLHFASIYNPVYTIDNNNTVFVYPTPDSTNDGYNVFYVNNVPTDETGSSSLAYDDVDIKYFPADKVYLVVMYAGIKSLQNAMSALHGNSDISTAFTAINTELDETQAICDLINTQVDSGVTEIAKAVTEAGEMISQTDNSSDFATALTALNAAVDKFQADGGDPALFGDETQYLTGVGLAHVKDALDLARNAIDTGFTTDEASGSGDDATPKSVGYWLNDEDTEMAQATLATAQTEIQRAQAHIGEWSATVQALQSEINGFAAEVQSRAAFTGAKGQAVQAYISTANAYIQTAQGYVSEVQAKIGISGGYGQEVQLRLGQAQAKREESNARIAAGSAYLQEASMSAQEAQTYAAEVNARVSQIGGYGQIVSGYLNAAQGYANEIQSKISISQGYIAEAYTRMAQYNQKYQWYQAQQVKLQQDYDRGIQMLISQGIPQQAQQGAR